MNAIITEGLGRRFGPRWALAGCTLAIPEGRVVGLVGANGAGKTTLLHLAAGLLEPSAGTIEVFGETPGAGPDQLARIGFVAQDAPIYSGLNVAEHLKLGRKLNHRWDGDLATRRIDRLGLRPGQKAGRLSGGERSQLALTLAMAKHPDLLVLDEPVASLDPLARRAFLADLMELVAEGGPTVVLSSHLVGDLERVCDHLVVLAKGQPRLDGPVEDLLATHKLLVGPRRDPRTLPGDMEVVQMSHTPRQTTALVRTTQPVLDPSWTVSELSLEELVLAYLATGPVSDGGPTMAVVAS
jgi:ABC-2 type transport system ATP-binding protein